MSLRSGRNFIDGIEVDLERKRIRRINIRVTPDGVIRLSVPVRWATLAEGEAFLRANWKWAVAARTRVLARPGTARTPVTPEERARLATTLAGLHALWAPRLGEDGVIWKLRTMKTLCSGDPAMSGNVSSRTTRSSRAYRMNSSNTWSSTSSPT